MKVRPKSGLSRAPLTAEEVRRRAAVLDEHAKKAEATAASTVGGASTSIYFDGMESCIRTIYRAIPEKKIDVFKMVAREGMTYARKAAVVVEFTDRLQEAAEATGLVEQVGQDAVQEWIAEAYQPEQETSQSKPEQSDPNVTTAQSKRTLVTQRASDVKPERIEWLWPGRLAAGKLTLIGGKPGLGKSQIAAFIAAVISNGGNWPCEEGRASRGSVVIFSAEDGVADTIVPRLIGAGANRDCIEIVTGVTDENGRKTFDLKADMDLLEAKVLARGDVVAVLIDPISAYMGKADGNGNVETRAVLAPIAEMADRLKIAVVAITHLNKGSGGTQGALERFAGSIAFIAAARTGFIVIEDDEEEGRLLFLQVKNNIAPKQEGLAFRLEQRPIEGDIVTSGVVWHEQHVGRTADEALAATEGRGGERSSKDEAADFLRYLLAAGPLLVKEIEVQAVEAGLLPEGKLISQSKMFRSARAQLGIEPRRSGGIAGSGSWVWGLAEAAKMPSKS